MPTFETPKTPRDFTEAMLRSSLEADQLAQENINDRRLLEAHTHTAVNGHIAAMAMEMLRHHAPRIADELAEHLHDTLVMGDLAGPTYRCATALSFDPDQWIADFNERAARRATKAEEARPAAHVALADLAGRWEKEATGTQKAIYASPLGGEVEAAQHERIRIYREAARDLREVLATGRIPHDLMTTAELGG